MSVAGGKNTLDVLTERGFVEQVTNWEGLHELLENPATCYIGFDPTADSLHVGSLVPIMALVHMQRGGHRPIVLVGGGTGMVGDPSGKTEMRQLLTEEQIEHNVRALKNQLSRFLDFGEGKALILNNGEWLLGLKYIEFLRDIGRHFSVNRMLAAESYRVRLETGLNFIEFNYMLLQAYDFYYLAKTYGCLVQTGGNDQWGNIVAGIDLIRKKLHREAFGVTFPLLTTATGAKMGKTAAGTVWLSGEKTSPYNFFQYWVNVDDRDVEKFLKLYTLLPVEEIEQVRGLEGEAINAAKSILAFEVTTMVHGSEAALEAYQAAVRVFGCREIPRGLLPSSRIPRDALMEDGAVPTFYVERSRLEAGIPAFELFAEAGLCESRSAARRLIQQGGAYLNGKRVDRFDALVALENLKEGVVLLRAGKKKVSRVCVAP